MNGFVHLHVHSEYSLLDGASRIEELVEQAANLGMSSLALTDHGVMYGIVPFYKACKERGVKPIIGCEIYFTSGSMKDKGTRQNNPIYHLVLLAKNEEGYRNLMRICSEAHLHGFHYKPRADFELLRKHAAGLICLSSCLAGEVSQHLLHDRMEEARQAAERYRSVFGDDFYLEIQDHGLIEQKKVMQGMIELHRKTGIPLVATNDVHYVRPGDHAVQDCLLCIGTGKTMDDEDRLKFHSRELYLKSAAEMSRVFEHVPEAVANTARIAEACRVELQFGQSILPEFRPIPDGLTSGEYLKRLCEEGMLRRYGDKPEWRQADYRQAVERRLAYELQVIGSMGFSDYFLIVWDFIRYAHEHGIVTGPGRGSSAGSLVAYVLRITDVDPIEYRLLFERFLNPERVTMPDIDIDFSDERRDEVIGYVSRKYGEEHVAQIITFGTMAAKAAVRDVGRVLNMPYNEVDRAAKMIPNQLGITIEAAMRLNPDLRELAARHPKTAELLEMARRIEGMPRHASTHAAGVVISREPLTHYVPLQEGTEHIALTQYSMEHLEAIGLLKMDFLGLRYLSIIERTLAWIEEQSGVKPDFREISMNDPKTYGMLCKGDTTGVFQMESAGMRRVLRELKPSAFEDIISVVALYRPGPMEFIPKFIQAKHGQIGIEYPHPDLEPILKDTYGIIVYQEQIMQIASLMAGFSLGQADLLRRAVSKKKREVLDEERAHFVRGSLSQGYTEAEANRVYDMIVRFADYGFPRAHATAYGVLAFQTAYLKAHYPVQFMASMLASVMGSHRKVAEYVDECRKMGIPVLPPDVNESQVVFTPVQMRPEEGGTPTGAVRFGLAAIKNVGAHAMETIIQERRERPYDSLADFCRRVDLRVCNKRVIESLIQGGAFDSLPGHRAQLIAMLEDAIEAAVKWKKDRDDLQLHLFGFNEEVNWTVEYPDVPPYTAMQQLELERELLGLFLSGHPLDAYEQALAEIAPDQIHHLSEYPEGQEVTVAGLVVSHKTIINRKGQQMAFMDLENRVAKVEVVLFADAWKAYGQSVQKGRPLLLKARLQHQEEDVKLIGEHLLPLDTPDWAEQLKVFRGKSASRRPYPQQDGRGGVRSGSGSASPSRKSQGTPESGEANRPTPVSPAPGIPAGNRATVGRPADERTTADRPSDKHRAVDQPAGNRPVADRPTAGAAAVEPPKVRASQKVYIRIKPDKEHPDKLKRLQHLLTEHAGPLEVVLFYEREQKLLALSDKYKVKPSPDLIRRVNELMGPDSAKVK